MKPLNSCGMKQALVVAIMATCVSFTVQAGEFTVVVNKDMLTQIMTLHGLNEDGAIKRLAAEEEATDLYRRVRSMKLPGYAGAWFDAESGKLHFTPTSASWLNAVERWFAQLERRALYRGVFGSVQELREAIRQFIDAHNAYGAKPFRWTKSVEVILAKVERAKLSIAGKSQN